MMYTVVDPLRVSREYGLRCCTLYLLAVPFTALGVRAGDIWKYPNL